MFVAGSERDGNQMKVNTHKLTKIRGQRRGSDREGREDREGGW